MYTMKEDFWITQLKCRHLPKIEKISPYVCVTFRDETKKTEWKANNYDPVYTESIGFNLRGNPITTEDELKVEVKLHKLKFVKDRSVGKTTISLTRLTVNGETQTAFVQTLNDANGNDTGAEIEFVTVCKPTTGRNTRPDSHIGRESIKSSVEDGENVLSPSIQENGTKKDSSSSNSEIGRKVSSSSKVDGGRKISSSSKAESGKSRERKKGVPSKGNRVNLRRKSTFDTIDYSSGSSSSNSESDSPKAPVRQRRIHELPDKPMFFQIKIRIIKGRHLPSINPSAYPSVRVIIDGIKKSTKPSRSSTQPFFNENLLFTFTERPNALFDKIVLFEVHNRKRIGKDTIIGTFSCDLGTFYFEKDHAVLKKWLLLTVPNDEYGDTLAPPGSPAGFLQINGIVLGTGDELPEKVTVTAGVDDMEDIQDNLLLPMGGASLETATFYVKVYKGEDLPQMDPDLSNFNFGETKMADLCDPYCTFSFAGQTVRTKTIKNTYSPEFNEELKISYKYPSMCERLKLQVFDWDRTSDDFIGTSFLSLHEITGLGDPDFLPSFGPSYVCYYGSLREYSKHNSKEAELMDRGLIEGAFYRGRILIELSSTLGAHDKKASPTGITESDLKRTKDGFLQRRKFILFATFMNGNMVNSDNELIEFEVSIGTYGNNRDNSGNPKFSSTLPVHPISYGNGYYYLPWHDSKPCCIVESSWEDISFRLEPKIFLSKIVNALNKSIEKLELAIKTKSEDKSFDMTDVIEDLLNGISKPFPILAPHERGVTPLDIQIQKTRVARLSQILKELEFLLKNPPNLDEDGVSTLKSYSRRIDDLTVEPQMSIPDIVISMISGGKIIAYSRIPTYTVMYSSSADTRGINCGKLQTVVMESLDTNNKDSIPVSLDVILWFGLDVDQDDWVMNKEKEGKQSVFAEMFENQWRMLPLGKWTNEECPESFSDITGSIILEKDDFTPPPGWKWDGEWFVVPQLDAAGISEGGEQTVTEVLLEIFENEKYVHMEPEKWKWSESLRQWTDEQNNAIENHNESLLPEGWTWEPGSDWEVDWERSDEEGWKYCMEINPGCEWIPIQKPFHRYRRRRYTRKRIVDLEYEAIKKAFEFKDHVKETDPEVGWTYANVLGKFHKVKSVTDISRRRRWRRMMIMAEPGPLPVFSVPSKENKNIYTEITPRTFLVFKEHRRWELRAYIYSARNIIGMNDDSTTDAFCKVTFHNRSYLTRIIHESLSPEWDETVVFDNLCMYGAPEMIRENPPFVNVELFDEEKVGQNQFIGRCSVQPFVRIQGPNACYRETCKLLWHPIKKAGFEGGELLAAFELFLSEGAALPKPSVKERKGKKWYVIPDNIRPVVIRTGVEVLLWGVRNLKSYQMAPCTSPSVVINIGKYRIESDIIRNIRKTPNFPKNDYFKDMYLPKDPFYMPPINIRVYDHRTWGRKPLVGTHVIKSVQLEDPPTKETVKLSILQSESKTSTRSVTVVDAHADLQAIMKKRKAKQSDREEDYLDWWSKFYASCGELTKCGAYLEKGYTMMKVYHMELEKVPEHGGLDDMVETFLLERGKEDEEDEEAGEFKGNFKLYPLPEDPSVNIDLRYFSSIKPMTKPIECTVRLYVIRGIELNPCDPNGKCDPYLVIELGSKKISNSENRIPCTLNPYFGQYYELKAKIPVVKDLTITVMDHDYGTKNDLVGSTTIDLENRLLSKARATIGLAPQYFDSGPYRWRDVKSPKEILKEVSSWKPLFNGEEELRLKDEKFKLSDFEESPPKNPHFGPAGERLALHVLHTKKFSDFKLVPEHVESRTLKNPFEPNIKQGVLQLFVDIFPAGGHIPPPINIKPRTPSNFVLRVIIWSTAEVPHQDTSALGEEMTDIYIKAWLDGCKEQKTDVHHRSLNGEGLFNWRMTYPFKYMPEESTMIIEEKEHFWSLDKTVEHVPPTFFVEVWDHDMFSRNDYIGSLELNLNRIPRPKKEKGECKPTMLNTDKTIDLFCVKAIKGWWVMTGKKLNSTEIEKKGEVEMSMEILTESEASERPAGKGREDPNANPKLEEPNRPDTSFLWLKNPLKSFRYIIWRRFKWKIIGFIVILLLLIFIYLFLASLIDYSAKAVVERPPQTATSHNRPPR